MAGRGWSLERCLVVGVIGLFLCLVMVRKMGSRSSDHGLLRLRDGLAVRKTTKKADERDEVPVVVGEVVAVVVVVGVVVGEVVGEVVAVVVWVDVAVVVVKHSHRHGACGEHVSLLFVSQ